VRSRLQVLRREGVILQSGDEVRVNPIHYPKLRSELSNNNYLIGEV
jgi:sugar diacid utilization regulator